MMHGQKNIKSNKHVTLLAYKGLLMLDKS